MNFAKKSMEDLQRKSVDEIIDTTKNNTCLILENVRSMQNVGAIFRSADAFLISELILVGYTPTPPHRDIHKSALGATESVLWSFFEHISEAIEYSKNKYNSKIIAIEQTKNSVPIQEFKKENFCTYILGNEVDGVTNEALSMSDAVLEIPQFGIKHSLNVSVTAGIILFNDFLITNN